MPKAVTDFAFRRFKRPSQILPELSRWSDAQIASLPSDELPRRLNAECTH